MPQLPPLDVLNQVLVLHKRSLPMYLSYAPPRYPEDGKRYSATIDAVVADQKQTVDRLGKFIIEHHGAVQGGGFPMSYTGLHDLDFLYLLGRLIDAQRHDVRVLQRCASQLDHAPLAKALVDEALGAAKGHLESLEELTRPAKEKPLVVGTESGASGNSHGDGSGHGPGLRLHAAPSQPSHH